jgi:hypothetical protein
MDQDKTILDTDPEAAHQETLTLWVSKGQAFSNERTARYNGCTHKKCACGNLTEKHYTYCEACRAKRDHERYLKMEFKEWDGKTPLVVFDTDTYFFDESDLGDYCENHNIKEVDLNLVLCEPTYAHEIEPNEYYCDDLPEEGEVSHVIQQAFDELNKALRESKEVLSWNAGKFRTKVES